MHVVAGGRASNDVLDELYAAPLRDFVARRNALAARLRARGKRAQATAVAGIARPKATVWAINKVARARPAVLRALIDAFERLKTAQLERPAKLADATRAMRRAVETATHAAIDALHAADVTVTLDTHRRIGNTLRGAAASERRALLAGELTQELAPGGFEQFGGAMPSGRRLRAVKTRPRAAEARPGARDDLARRRAEALASEATTKDRAARAASAAALDARERLRELQAQARAATKAATTSRVVAERARRRAERARRRATRRP